MAEPIVGEIRYQRRDGTTTDEEPAPPKARPVHLDLRLGRHRTLRVMHEWIFSESAKREAMSANVASVKKARRECKSVEGRVGGEGREPSSNGLCPLTRDGRNPMAVQRVPCSCKQAARERAPPFQLQLKLEKLAAGRNSKDHSAPAHGISDETPFPRA